MKGKHGVSMQGVEYAPKKKGNALCRNCEHLMFRATGKNKKPFSEEKGVLLITTCAYGRLQPFSCALRSAFRNARVCALPGERRCGRTAA